MNPPRFSEAQWKVKTHSFRSGFRESMVGENCHLSKLSLRDAQTIKSLKSKEAPSEVAVRFCVHQKTVQDIWSGRTWSDALKGAEL